MVRSLRPLGRLALAAALLVTAGPAAVAQAHEHDQGQRPSAAGEQGEHNEHAEHSEHGEPAHPALACAALTGHDLSRAVGHPATITSATAVPATPTVPAYCDVSAAVTVTAKDATTSTIHLRLQVPDAWNRRYVQLGGGGFCGTIPTEGTAGDATLSQGYAVASDDTGHTGTALDATFGYDNTATQLTWGYLSEHLTALASKATLRATTGHGPTYSYFVGCSTGGRQALMEAQRFPDDFDGIVAGAPANRQNYLAPLSQGVRELQNHRADRSTILDLNAASVVQKAVLARCDGTGVGGDTVKDGIVSDPRLCDFDPATVECTSGATSGCLTAEQVAVLQKWYDSPRGTNGRELYPGGLPVGSEGGWPGYDIIPGALSGGGMFAEQVLRYLAFPADPGPTYSLFDFDPTRDAARLRTLARIYNSDSTDLDAFRRHGGKLILYHGLADPLITPFGTIQYYEDVVQRYGGLQRTEQFARLFLLPGVYHCTGGPGPDSVDWLAAIRGWTEHGQAPRRLVASKVSTTGTTTMQRPVFPYPLEARYVGSGDPDSVTAWKPVRGPRGRATSVG